MKNIIVGFILFTCVVVFLVYALSATGTAPLPAPGVTPYYERSIVEEEFFFPFIVAISILTYLGGIAILIKKLDISKGIFFTVLFFLLMMTAGYGAEFAFKKVPIPEDFSWDEEYATRTATGGLVLISLGAMGIGLFVKLGSPEINPVSASYGLAGCASLIIGLLSVASTISNVASWEVLIALLTCLTIASLIMLKKSKPPSYPTRARKF